jgi:hypothetical protein
MPRTHPEAGGRAPIEGPRWPQHSDAGDERPRTGLRLREVAQEQAALTYDLVTC